MWISDPIYGRFEVPDFIAELLSTPEVRRLSNIRLLNALSPSLATLGEIRRYSHTLGVIYLASRNSFLGFDSEEVRAFFAAVLLHDIGTPPFGHLFEYQLRDRFHWHHEDVIASTISGTDKASATGHQIYGGRAIQFLSVCHRLKIDEKFLISLVSRRHPLSKLIFGSLDFDNLDNVIRMAWALGINARSAIATDIAASLSVSHHGDLLLPTRLRPIVEEWLALRRRVYDILVFDGPTVAAQAVLSKAIASAFDEGVLSINDWDRHDEELIDLLRRSTKIKTDVIREYLGKLPSLVICIQVKGSLKELGFPSLQDAKATFDDILSHKFLTYVFLDNGAFEKRLEFLDGTEQWSVGKLSQSLILYAFGSERHQSERRGINELRDLLSKEFTPRTLNIEFHA
jgi:HD superfamily phosphohydrolase